MPIRITCRSKEEPINEIKACLKKKLARLTRIVGAAQKVAVTVSRDAAKNYLFEIVFRAGPLEASATAKDKSYITAIDLLIPKLERQLSKSMHKLRGDTKRAARSTPKSRMRKDVDSEALESKPAPEVSKEFEVEPPPPILIKSLGLKVFPVLAGLTPKMSVVEAAESLLERKIIFIFFRNTDSANKRSMLFRRPDGHFILVEM